MSQLTRETVVDELNADETADPYALEDQQSSFLKKLGGPTLTILVVEDDLVNRIVLKGVLTKFGFNVLLAENGQQAVDFFEQQQPALILMDIRMPEMDGYNATEKIKSLSKDHYTPILFLTAVTDEEAMVKCIESGGDDFLSKPFSPVILRTRIESLLRTRELYQIQQNQNESSNVREAEAAIDLNIAERILSKISRREAFDVKNIKYHLSPMERLNGDIIVVAHKPTGGQIYLLGDFTGHGLGAAIGGLVVFDVFKTMATKGFSMLQIISEINRKLKELLPTSRFLASAIVELDAAHTTASIWNGGLPAIYHRSEETQEIRSFPSTDIPLGILDNDELDLNIVKTPIQRGDQIFIYSDGVIESENKEGKFFGEKGLIDSIQLETEAQKAFENILFNVSQFSQGLPQGDDISLLEIICDPSMNHHESEMKNSNLSLPASHWELDFMINIDTIKQVDIVPSLVQMVVDIQGLHHYHKPLYLIISELYSNALEQGLLDLDRNIKESYVDFEQYESQREDALGKLEIGRIKIGLRHEPFRKGGRLVLRVTHDGDGYNIASHKALSGTSNNEPSVENRGIHLVESLVSRFELEDFGRIVEVDYFWGQD